MLSSAKPGSERATERVAELMTTTQKAAYTEQASRMGLSLGQNFREAGAAYASAESQERADPDALEAALRQLEFSTARTEAALDSALAEVRAALQVNRAAQRQS